MMKLGRRGVLAAGATLAVSPAARADDLSRPSVKFVVGFPAGGATDVVGRLLAQRLGEMLGQADRGREQAGRRRATSARRSCADSRPDGYTLLVGNSIMSIVPALYDKLPYDPVNGLDAVAHFTTVPMIIVAPAGGVKSIEELVGAAAQGAGQALLSVARQRQPDPYQQPPVHPTRRRRGVARALSSGSAPATRTRWPAATPSRSTLWGASGASSMPAASPVLAVCAEKRLPALPDVPTVQEKLGFPFNVSTWNIDLRAGRHATADRRQAQRRHQRGDQESRADREGQAPRDRFVHRRLPRRRPSTNGRWPSGCRS